MAKRSDFSNVSKRIDIEEEKEEEKEKPKKVRVTKAKTETDILVLLKDISTLNVIGSVTGKKYTFSGAGSMIEVDKRDVDKLLMKSGNESCCSGDTVSSPYFELVR